MTQVTPKPNMAAMPKHKKSAGRFLIDWAAVITLVASVAAFTLIKGSRFHHYGLRHCSHRNHGTGRL